ncbi:hypothetical protein [Pelagibius sp. 7325]|uniref:hypothetical protein n=1 Tax=Pelagibius sp. 7325 TaxID=3131994 RepID=UPI0030ED389B
MTGAKLPELPKGSEFEELVAGILQTGGNFTERKIIERDKVDILELDIISTDYNDKLPNLKLVEAKSGSWGSSDVFKICGWMTYLNIPNGLLVTLSNRDHIDRIQKRAEALGIDLQPLENLKKAPMQLAAHTDGNPLDSRDVSTWRFSYWVERNLLKKLKASQKSPGNAHRYDAMWNYFYELTSGIFFTRNIVSRLESLYDLYAKYPRLSARCSAEMSGKDFDGDASQIENDHFNRTFYDCEYNDLQISCFVEHMARLSILKAAVDYVLYSRMGDEERTKKEWEIFGSTYDWFEALPGSFRSGLDEIKDDPFVHRYPILWQWFMWVFGGFFLCDYEEQEIALLAEKSRIPPNQVQRALECYDLLFPTDGGWFRGPTSTSNMRFLNLFPVPFRGVGANYRRLTYCKKGTFDELQLSKRYTLKDVIKANNLTVKVLSS